MDVLPALTITHAQAATLHSSTPRTYVLLNALMVNMVTLPHRHANHAPRLVLHALDHQSVNANHVSMDTSYKTLPVLLVALPPNSSHQLENVVTVLPTVINALITILVPAARVGTSSKAPHVSPNAQVVTMDKTVSALLVTAHAQTVLMEHPKVVNLVVPVIRSQDPLVPMTVVLVNTVSTKFVPIVAPLAQVVHLKLFVLHARRVVYSKELSANLNAIVDTTITLMFAQHAHQVVQVVARTMAP